MQHLSLTPATQAVLDALRELGQGNVGELAEKSGKARSTTDKAIKTLADAGVIVPVDADADAAEGIPTQWTLSDDIAAQAEGSDPTNAADLNDDLAQTQDGRADDREGDTDDTDDTDSVADNNEEGVTADTDENAYDEDGDGEGEEDNADDQNDADDEDADDAEDEDDEDENAEIEDEDADDEDDDDRGTVTVVQPSRPGDRKVMTIKAVLAEHGDDGATLDEIVAESGIGHPTASRLLTAMEQADAARLLDGRPLRWVAGPTKASEVDPNPEPPRCVWCFQVIKGMSESPGAVAQVKSLVRPDGTLHVVAEDGTVHTVTLPKRTPTRTPGFATAGVRRTDVTVNADGSQPFAKGELEKLTMSIFAANAGREMTPQEIATAISAQLGGREVSSGAVRNNCGKLGAAGRIVMVSDSPWRFVLPVQTEDGDADQADDATDEQS